MPVDGVVVESRVRLRTNRTGEKPVGPGVLEREAEQYRIAFSAVAPLVPATLQVNLCDDKTEQMHWTRVDRADALELLKAAACKR